MVGRCIYGTFLGDKISVIALIVTEHHSELLKLFKKKKAFLPCVVAGSE